LTNRSAVITREDDGSGRVDDLNDEADVVWPNGDNTIRKRCGLADITPIGRFPKIPLVAHTLVNGQPTTAPLRRASRRPTAEDGV
jgi:hypothetical protein